MFLVRCLGCQATGYTEQVGPGDLDHAVRCISPADEPAGSAEGSCSTLGHTHDEHVAHVRATGNASSRPVVIEVVPGSVELKVTP